VSVDDRITVVDDDRAIRDMLRVRVARSGFEVSPRPEEPDGHDAV
jgi:DNA-binding response OmpR family regulator